MLSVKMSNRRPTPRTSMNPRDCKPLQKDGSRAMPRLQSRRFKISARRFESPLCNESRRTKTSNSMKLVNVYFKATYAIMFVAKNCSLMSCDDKFSLEQFDKT
jgi:hypothetical protein